MDHATRWGHTVPRGVNSIFEIWVWVLSENAATGKIHCASNNAERDFEVALEHSEPLEGDVRGKSGPGGSHITTRRLMATIHPSIALCMCSPATAVPH